MEEHVRSWSTTQEPEGEPKDLSQYSRQVLLETAVPVKEVDFKGHFHPNELVRKVGREIVRMGYHIESEDLKIEKTPVGGSTGQFVGVVHGVAAKKVRNAGHYTYLWIEGFVAALLLGASMSLLGLFDTLLILVGAAVVVLFVVFRENLFNREFTYDAEIRAELIVSMPGELYEDFRREERIPISTNASALVARRFWADWIFADPRHELIRQAGRGHDEDSGELLTESQVRMAKLEEDTQSLVRKMEAERDALL